MHAFAHLLQVDPVPVFLRADKYTYATLGLSVGYFAVDMVTCLKYHVSKADRDHVHADELIHCDVVMCIESHCECVLKCNELFCQFHECSVQCR
jgi:hypothetical protein